MPTYVYACDCGSSEEKILPMSKRDDAQECGSCGGIMKRQITFSGTVWAPTSSSGGHR